VEVWETGEAGRHFQVLYDGAQRGEWQLVGHGERGDAVVAGVDELIDLLGGCYPFRPTATVGESATELWLPEIGLHVSGATLDEARLELATAMLAFARTWAEQAVAVPGPRMSNGYARRIQLAHDTHGVLAMVDRDATRDALPMRAERPWTEADPDKPRRWLGPHDRIAGVRAALAQESDDGDDLTDVSD
jgi:hypothetical protein